MTPLMYAAQSGSAPVFKTLIAEMDPATLKDQLTISTAPVDSPRMSVLTFATDRAASGFYYCSN